MMETGLGHLRTTGSSGLNGTGQPHPALPRFRAQPVPEERLLIIRVPGGMGAEWFAAGWAAHGSGSSPATPEGAGSARVLRWDSALEDAETFSRRVGRRLAEQDGPVAVVASANAPIHDVAAVHPCRLADPTDVLLTAEEIGTLAQPPPGGPARPMPRDPEVVYRLSGGWLVAVQALLAPQQSPRAARQALIAPLLRWLRARDPLGVMAETAYLPEFSEGVLSRFHPASGSPAPALRDLATEALVRDDGTGRWFMPELVRRCITDYLQEKAPDRVDSMVRAAVEATDRAGRVGVALEAAASRGAWTPFDNVLANRAAELFTSDAQHLRALLARIPEPVLAQRDHLRVALRILASAGPEGVALPLPSVEPDLRRDRTAIRLRARAARKYLRPNGRAVAYGMVEISYLRLSGHYAAATDAAVQLRRAVRGALDSGPISIPLASIAELHAGLCLHLADRLDEAGLAYTSALDLARHGNHDFLEADALSKLALLSAHQGEFQPARSWLAQLDGPLSRVGWGRPLVSRCGDLARAWCALAGLDLEAAGEVLARLPAEPDTDEFWSAHAQLLALLCTLRGDPNTARRQVRTLRRDRPYASRAPLADRLLTEAHHYAELVGGTASEIRGWQQNSALANLEACRCLGGGSVDGALRALSRPPRIGRQQRLVAALLRSYATSAAEDGAAEGLPDEAADLSGPDGELIDLVTLVHLGCLPDLVRYGIVTEDQAARLSALPQPVLAREQPPTLTAREREVLELLRLGMTRRQMAEHTSRSENTIKGQLRSLYAKLGAEKASDALERAQRYGL
jgi:LuxR family maltose regulon positive regulatory protein